MDIINGIMQKELNQCNMEKAPIRKFGKQFLPRDRTHSFNVKEETILPNVRRQKEGQSNEIFSNPSNKRIGLDCRSGNQSNFQEQFEQNSEPKSTNDTDNINNIFSRRPIRKLKQKCAAPKGKTYVFRKQTIDSTNS